MICLKCRAKIPAGRVRQDSKADWPECPNCHEETAFVTRTDLGELVYVRGVLGQQGMGVIHTHIWPSWLLQLALEDYQERMSKGEPIIDRDLGVAKLEGLVDSA